MISYNSLTSILTLVTALGCGTIAGVFFAFSTFVMRQETQFGGWRRPLLH
jgi:uncharacterized membrane protein